MLNAGDDQLLQVKKSCNFASRNHVTGIQNDVMKSCNRSNAPKTGKCNRFLNRDRCLGQTARQTCIKVHLLYLYFLMGSNWLKDLDCTVLLGVFFRAPAAR